MASQETVPVQTSPPSKKSTWVTVSAFIQGYALSIAGGISMLVIAYTLGHCNCFGLVRGRISQERRRRKLLKERHDEDQKEQREQLAHIAFIINDCTSVVQDNLLSQSNSSHDKLRKNMNSLHHKSLDNMNSSHDKLREELRDDTEKIGLELLAELRIRIPESEKADGVEQIVRERFSRIRRRSDRIDDLKGSRILQFKVGLKDGILDEVHNLADALTEIEEAVTVQLDNFRVFLRTDEGVEMKTLDVSHEVPVILRAAYAAGKLTIEGLNLKNATIKAATLDECLTLENVGQPQVLDGLEVYTWIVQLPSRNFEEIAVYAMKTILIEKQEVSVCSSVVKIQDNNLRTVVRIGIPSVVWMIYFTKQLYHDGIQLIKWSNLGPDLAWMVPILVVILTQLVPPRT